MTNCVICILEVRDGETARYVIVVISVFNGVDYGPQTVGNKSKLFPPKTNMHITDYTALVYRQCHLQD